MSKYNSKSVSSTQTTNLAGGVAYKESTKLEVASMLVTAYLAQDTFYETESQMVQRLEYLYQKLNGEDKLFLAKASIYARDKFRLRSISHLCSAIIAEGIVNNTYSNDEKRSLENYFAKVVLRMDDITETISAYKSRPLPYTSKKGTIQLPNVVKRGFSKAIAGRDEYQFAKYRAEGKETSLIDAVRMIHAKATPSNKEALDKLVKGSLKNVDTWETKKSQAGKAGSEATTTTEKEELVKEANAKVWEDFVSKGNKIEYFALLRNLRKIYQQASEEVFEKACNLLCEENLIKKAGMLPLHYLVAYKQFYQVRDVYNFRDVSISSPQAVRAISRAIDMSLSNVPKFTGKTAILVDLSGSMTTPCTGTGSCTCVEVACLFASALYKANNADVVTFDSSANFFTKNPDDSVVTLAYQMVRCGGGTDFSCAFKKLSKKYDRIIILSDMQSWMDGNKKRGYYSESANDAFNAYRKKYNTECKLYSFDLTGNGTLKFPERNVYQVAGLSNTTFDIMSKMEEDKSYLVHEIEKIVL